MSLKNINAALAVAVQGCGIAYPVAWEGKTFVKPAAAPWMAVWLMPAYQDALQTVDKHGGIMQIDINHPLNSGLPVMLADTDILAAYFNYFIVGDNLFCGL